jgi:hypothetical protein
MFPAMDGRRLICIDPFFDERWPKYCLSMSAKLNLCGSYLVHIEFEKSEIGGLYRETHDDTDIARLFYKKFGHLEPGDMLKLLISLKDDMEKEARKAAMYKSAIDSLIEKNPPSPAGDNL